MKKLLWIPTSGFSMKAVQWSGPIAWREEMPPGITNGWNTWKETLLRVTLCQDQVSFPDHLVNREKSTEKSGNIGQLKMKLNGKHWFSKVVMFFILIKKIFQGWKEEPLPPPRSLITGPHWKTFIPLLELWLQFKLLLPSLTMAHPSRIIPQLGQRPLPIQIYPMKSISMIKNKLCLLLHWLNLQVIDPAALRRSYRCLCHLNPSLRGAGKRR